MKKLISMKYMKAFSQKMNLMQVIPLRSGIRVFSAGLKGLGRIKGSLTVEAALVMPVFLFFMISILYVFQIISIQAETYQELHQRGNRLAFEGYQNREQYDDGLIELTEAYRIKPFLFWQDFGQLGVVQKYYGYAWIGYDVNRGDGNNEAEKEYVYIAETGTVYHITMDCSHLKLSITNVDSSLITTLRNDSGGRYQQCERCPDVDNGIFFITSFGTRYHSDVNCSGLKRTVSIHEISEAIKKGYRACSRCS